MLGMDLPSVSSVRLASRAFPCSPCKAARPPPAPAFGSCGAARPIEALGLRKAFLGLYNAFVSKWVLDN